MIIPRVFIPKMSGYKRVNFYELCRLCATNQQKEKTHIFQEEGRKIQLQNKIQSCLSLKVCENDFLPKVVCSQCLRTLEECCVFRKECYTSETMLSSYFNNFRYTDDFKKSGKVYIKDTSPKTTAVPQPPPEPTSNYINVVSTTPETLPYYTLQLPAQPQPTEPKKDPKVITQPQIIYNLNTIKSIVPKTVDPVNNIINSNGEIITIGSLVDMDSLVPVVHKPVKKKRLKELDDVIKIDLTHQDKAKILKRDAIPLINSLQIAGRVNQPTPTVNRPHKFLNFNNMCMSACSNNVNVSTAQIPNTAVLTETPVMTTLPSGYNQYSTGKEIDDLYNGVLRNSAQSFPQVYSNSASNQVVEPAPKPDVVVKRHPCDICGKTFKRREHLYQHLKLHTGFRPFTCENCNKSFLRKEHLLRHMVAHSGQKNFTCTTCNKSFSRNDNLLKHKKIHNKQNSFTCEVCQKQFVMEHYYFAHKRTHDNEKCINQAWGLLKAI